MAEKKRINVTLSAIMFDEIGELAEFMGISVPAMLVVLASRQLEQDKAVKAMGNMSELMNQMKSIEEKIDVNKK